jgi:hypothetical protein
VLPPGPRGRSPRRPPGEFGIQCDQRAADRAAPAGTVAGVSDAGALVEEDVPWTQDVVIETMEALLIESLEPPLNRKRGDNFSAVEFVQVTDPQIEKRQKQALLEEMRRSMGLD